jgi:hypothetical protein
MKKIILAISLLISIIETTQAQNKKDEYKKGEFLVSGSVGLSNLSYSLANDSKVSGGIGFGLGAGYTYRFTQSLGITTGLEFALYGAKAECGAISETYPATDDVGERFTFSYTARNYTETQSVALLSLPVMLQYRSGMFYAAGGLKFGLPVSVNAKISQTVSTSGHYEYENRTYDDLTQHQFFNGHSVSGSEGKPDLGLATMLSLETGVRLDLSETMGLYLGAYLDYGFTDMKKTADKHAVNYDGILTYESVLNMSLVDKVNLMSVGIKVKLAL